MIEKRYIERGTPEHTYYYGAFTGRVTLNETMQVGARIRRVWVEVVSVEAAGSRTLFTLEKSLRD